MLWLDTLKVGELHAHPMSGDVTDCDDGHSRRRCDQFWISWISGVQLKVKLSG